MTKKKTTAPTFEEMTGAAQPDGMTHFTITDLHKEVQLFFEHLKRVNPAVFGQVSPEFITENLENFDASFHEFNAKAERDAQARAAALAEAKEEIQREYDQRRNAHYKKIEEAAAKVKAEQSALINAQDELRQREFDKANPK